MVTKEAMTCGAVAWEVIVARTNLAAQETMTYLFRVDPTTSTVWEGEDVGVDDIRLRFSMWSKARSNEYHNTVTIQSSKSMRCTAGCNCGEIKEGRWAIPLSG